jgi:hypothetical protein
MVKTRLLLLRAVEVLMVWSVAKRPSMGLMYKPCFRKHQAKCGIRRKANRFPVRG